MAETFEWPLRVYYEDTDAQGVVYYANYFRFMERARTEWLRALGIDQVAMARDEHRIFVVTETQAKFLIPARLSDQLIATATLGHMTRATFEIKQDIYRNSLNGELLIRGGATVAYLDTETMKPKRLPSTLFEGSSS